ncbi:hypothetical protein H5410_031822 [Solanum commersonii]|uniref:Uncharacterized protein n=1 Tax=Solanum commersonii TaxID=4109 RepID=A0A9J5YMU4_SOLCO|nr:hypothetical protein H5410_031822 [Solanum commersonii]
MESKIIGAPSCPDSRSPHGVGLWKSICKIKDEFFQITKLAAGNGIHIRFWKDRTDNTLNVLFKRNLQNWEIEEARRPGDKCQEPDKLWWGSDKDGKYSVNADYANSYAPNELLDNWPWKLIWND